MPAQQQRDLLADRANDLGYILVAELRRREKAHLLAAGVHRLVDAIEKQRVEVQAWRAAHTGVVVAEPWFDRTVPSQRTADDLDLWLKVQHRRTGRVHHPNIPPAGLLGLITQSATTNDPPAAPTLAWDQHVHLRFRPLDAAFAEADALAHGLPQDHADRRALQALKLRAASTGVSCNGSATVVATR